MFFVDHHKTEVGTCTELAPATLRNNWEEGNIMIKILGSNPSSVTHCFSDTILGLSFLTHKMEIIIERLTGLLWGVWWSTQKCQHCIWEVTSTLMGVIYWLLRRLNSMALLKRKSHQSCYFPKLLYNRTFHIFPNYWILIFNNRLP